MVGSINLPEMKTESPSCPSGGVHMYADCRSRGREFEPGHITSMEIDHEIISTAILLLLLIEEGQLLVTGDSMCTMYWVTA